MSETNICFPHIFENILRWSFNPINFWWKLNKSLNENANTGMQYKVANQKLTTTKLVLDLLTDEKSWYIYQSAAPGEWLPVKHSKQK